ncbi:MAG: hypothetical protein JRG94_06230 [Deltaproteobacteria bacterium]|nr:hypothetical protein [Deltaproteobacteria bacterium]
MLHMLAEVSIAFTGFSGVVGVFGGGSALSEDERVFRIRLMIVASLAAFFGSLFPLVLGQFESVTSLVWFLCCPLYAGYVILNSLSVYRQTRVLESGGNYSRPWFAPIIYSVSLLLALALIGATFALLPAHSVYIAGIVWQLALASLQFLILVLGTAPRSTGPE